MALTMNASAKQIGRAFASEIAGRPSVGELWVSTSRGVVDMWLLATEMDANEERSVYRLLNILDERFGDVEFQLHILNPATYTIPLHDVLPKGAVKIFPRAA